ncbi:MAG: D-alanyl-D-alanine carboxypeptidase [Oscillospiraceae bacterium]|nr:D-alanyl-D-alanine carboxypeptidase [Oscillospiraceae bacterium]
MKKFIGLLLTLSLLSSLQVNIYGTEKNTDEAGGITVDCKSAILIEPTSGKILYEKNSNEKFAPASVTKVMTMLLAMEKIDSGEISLKDTITVSENAKAMGGSTMLLDTGEVRTVEEILKGIAICSGNDAAVAMAEYIGGSEQNFVKMMNERAKQLGMINTTFLNSNGLPANGHLSTAKDISIMSIELLKHPLILKYTGIYMETLSEGRKTPIEMVNHNKLVRFFPGCDGLKTGFTDEAKYCISATAKRDGVRMLAIIVGAPTWQIRNREAAMLMNYGFSQFVSKQLAKKDEDIEQVPLNKKGDKFFILKAQNDLSCIVLRSDKSEIKKVCKYELKNRRYLANEVIGKCEFYMGNDLVGEVDIYTDREFKVGGIVENIKDNLRKLMDLGI